MGRPELLLFVCTDQWSHHIGPHNNIKILCLRKMKMTMRPINVHMIAYLNWTPILEWCGVMCCSKNGHLVNIIGGDLYDHLMSSRIFMLIMNEI